MGQKPLSLDDESEDEDEDGDAPRPSRKKPEYQSTINLQLILSIVGLVVWGMLLCSVCLGGLLFCSALGKAGNAIQEASVSAFFAAIFIGLYIVVRSIEKIMGSVERMAQNKRDKAEGASRD